MREGGYIVVGVEEVNGRPVRPVKGIDIDKIEPIEKDMIGFNNPIKAGCSKKEIAEYLHVHPSTITQEFLEEVERKLNERPRKRHGFLSPNQVFSKSTGLDARVFV